MSGRLFTFGCSFTSYEWPTWADILAKQFAKFENWGMCGAGNQYITNALVECHLRNVFTKNDTVIIMWSTVTREDRYINCKWQTPGNIFTQEFYPADYVKRYADIRGYYIRDLASIYMTHQLLKSIGCNYHFLSMVPITNADQYTGADSSDSIRDLLPFYKETLDCIAPSVFEIVFDSNWSSRPFLSNLEDVRIHYNNNAGPDWPTFEQFVERDFSNTNPKIVQEILDTNRWDWDFKVKCGIRSDMHPVPSEHLEYLSRVLPKYVIDQGTKEWVRELDNRLWQKHPFTDLWEPVIIKRW